PYKRVYLSSQDFQCHEKREKGFLYQTGFSYQDYPVWSYLVEGVEVVRTIALMPGSNVVGISYKLINRSEQDVTLKVRPHLQFVPKGHRLSAGQRFTLSQGKLESNGQTLYLHTNGDCRELPVHFYEDLYYQDDVKDGKMALGRTAVNHEICITVEKNQESLLELVYGTEEKLPKLPEILHKLSEHRAKMQEGFENPTARILAASAAQFVSHRDSTGHKTILAGFPFFEDWGRDTMIALTGCCLSTGQYDTAKSILQTFMAHCRRGLMPNLFPEGTEDAVYNTVDAALLFILAIYEYRKRTGDDAFVTQAYPVMQDIIRWYAQGTDYGIHMDQDGLIMAGQGYDQVTWMDVRVEDILPTPRHGKPVEINAYWYNALRIMEELSQEREREAAGNSGGEPLIDYGAMADKVLAVFEKTFYNEEKGCLKDVISGTGADDQVRCNQIWVVSLPFSLLPREKEKRVVETVFRKLYTPVGLRTLAPEDAQFHPFYGGAQLDRDLAYHQGTVWTFPLEATIWPT
ncbi:MAG: glycogen debranching enzyme N-terminal domain-containing protein, partial [Acetatifactor sp.]|nr:glycogen debranching enzyme N-terminal domain-containing protein [Acetatifactor sp.]